MFRELLNIFSTLKFGPSSRIFIALVLSFSAVYRLFLASNIALEREVPISVDDVPLNDWLPNRVTSLMASIAPVLLFQF